MKTPQKLLFGVGVFLSAGACAPAAQPAAEAHSWTTPGGVYSCLAEADESGEYDFSECSFEPAAGKGHGTGSGSGSGTGAGSSNGSGTGEGNAWGSGSGEGMASGSGTVAS